MAAKNAAKNTKHFVGKVKNKWAHHGLTRAELAEARRRIDVLIEKETGHRPDPKYALAWVQFASENFQLGGRMLTQNNTMKKPAEILPNSMRI